MSLVVSKSTSVADVELVSGFLGLPAFGVIPLDEEVRRAERAGLPVLLHAPESPAVTAMVRMAERLDTGAYCSAHAP